MQNLDNFKQLSLVKKKAKVRKMIIDSDLTKLDTVFISIVDAIDNNNPNVNDDFLLDIYSNIMSMGEKIHKLNQEKKMEQFKKLHSKVKELHKRESEERAAENADESLDNALNNI